MTSEAAAGHGYQVAPQGLSAQVEALSGLRERTTGLVGSAGRLAERLPQLGTAPPAIHLAMRLREAGGRSGLSGEISAADAELNNFRTALGETVSGYLASDDSAAQALRNTGGDRA
ncbi:hypothetical protein SAMN02982929_01640 [Saccharopolyspora kobensis]|uniref:Excreted virulence factor EspC, type VII ESX diderm n=1 Tax=Saccharopolyspora kobensis TaxID=146035 RepID=A0A1H5XU20_9PSEU|nr:hypothetical protein [Saccharopolyspora kobensis]SEG15178.1 hypothetical protein SAMN02982929_01640 [Saccharopolyspora kobensis]SFF11341.1 hypothetical protein SAMN05216506_119102 [Saccharopolyspora kobensis]